MFLPMPFLMREERLRRDNVLICALFGGSMHSIARNVTHTELQDSTTRSALNDMDETLTTST